MNPAKVLENHRVTITDVNENGEGFARIGRMAVFIPGLVTGDIADIAITETRKNYAVGKCINLISESEHRTAPICSDFGVCGGCTLCHVTYEFENQIKQNCVKSALRRAGLSYDCVEPTRFVPNRTEYRNKIGLHYDKEIGAFGYRVSGSTKVLPFTHCFLCTDIMNEIVRFANSRAYLLNVLSPSELYVRRSHDGTITVSVYGSEDGGDISPFRTALVDEFSVIRDVLLFSDGSDTESSAVTEDYLGVSMSFSSETFRQVNHDAAEILMKLVCDFAAEKPFSYAADLYCGSGAFGLVLAKNFPNARFFGLEIDRDAIVAARANAVRNKLSNISFVCADSATFDGKIPDGNGSFYPPELVVADPPRAGLSEKMRVGLLNLAPERLAYVSCNPQTMARDLSYLVRGGYVIERVIPVNMFPMTRHVECVVLMTKLYTAY